jgi:hypothetical protein
MQYRRTLAWLAVLMTLVLALAGCAPRPGAGEAATAAPADALVIDFPSLAIDVAEDGSLSMDGIPLGDLAGSFGAGQISDLLRFPPDTLDMLTSAGIQHLQLANGPDGLIIVANGREMPAISWSDAQLQALGSMLGEAQQLAELLPMLTRLGIGVTLRLPVPAGEEPLPLVSEAPSELATRLASAQESVQPGTTGRIQIPIVYAADGTWTLNNQPMDFWLGLPGFSALEPVLRLNVQRFQEAGIESVTINTDANGLHLSTNDQELFALDWSGDRLANLLDFALSSGLLNIPNIDPAMLQNLLNTFLPRILGSDVSINLIFPQS